MLSASNEITEEKVALGRMLFYDERLSKGRNISCNTCHLLERYGVDGLPVSIGHQQQKGTRNAPSVYYAAGHVIQFWDGRSGSVEEQVRGPMLNGVEMGMPDAAGVEAALVSIPGYKEAFRKAFPAAKASVSIENASYAIAAFERKLVTPSRWDKFLSGDGRALTGVEKAGFVAFYRAGCHTCHRGPYLGGTLYQKVGMVKAWPNQADLGRFLITRLEQDRMVFKVPSLRNVEKTGPYFHDGSVGNLRDAVRMMGEHQVERPLTESEIRQIAAWMGSLTGEIPTDYIRRPELPKGD